MGLWIAIGAFLLGSGAGALVTAAFYSSQFRELKRLIGSGRRNGLPEERPKPEDVRRKSA